MADTEVQQLIIYVGTQQKINEAKQQGQITDDDFVVVTDAPDYALLSALTLETTNRENADTGLQRQIDAITASSDVKDIVGTYAELEAYDTSTLGNNDIIKVLKDETHDNETTYYRWNTTTQTFTLIGEEGPYLTPSAAAETYVPLTRTINNKTLDQNISLNASDVGALPDSTVIPTVNNATLTIQKNGTNVATFTANSSTNETANITVPTQPSDINAQPAGNYATTDTAQTITAQKTFETSAWTGGPKVKRTNSNSSFVMFENADGVLGGLGISANELPLWISKNTTPNRVLVMSGTNSAPATGSATQPVYIDSNGVAQTCSGIATNATATTISSNDTVTLANNTCFRGATLSAFTISVPASYEYPFICEIDFVSGSTATTITYSGGGTITWSPDSDDLVSGVFVPAVNTEYTLMFWYNGTSLCGIARGM